MSSDREVTRIVRSWLEEGVTTLPDRVLDDVLDRLPTTPQRRAAWPARRFQPMHTLRIAIAAAAVIVAAVVGINLLPAQGVGTGPAASPSPTPSSTSSSRPTPSPVATLPGGMLAVPPSGFALEPGTYLIQDPFPVRLSLTMGEGWSSWSGTGPYAVGFFKDSPDPPRGLAFGLLIVDNVNADACDRNAGLLDPKIGPTPEDLAVALASQPMTDASPISDVSVDGHPGRFLDYTMTGVPEPGCVAGQTLTRWPGREALLDERDQVWIVEVDGVRLVIDAASFPGTLPADIDEMRAMVESIQIQ